MGDVEEITEGVKNLSLQTRRISLDNIPRAPPKGMYGEARKVFYTLIARHKEVLKVGLQRVSIAMRDEKGQLFFTRYMLPVEILIYINDFNRNEKSGYLPPMGIRRSVSAKPVVYKEVRMYKCGQCGQPKKGHVCPHKGET